MSSMAVFGPEGDQLQQVEVVGLLGKQLGERRAGGNQSAIIMVMEWPAKTPAGKLRREDKSIDDHSTSSRTSGTSNSLQRPRQVTVPQRIRRYDQPGVATRLQVPW